MKRRYCSFLIFTALFILLYHGMNQVLFEKQHFGTAKNIAAEEKERIDVMFVGPSHIFYGINPMELWDKAGIAAYNLTTHQQPIRAGKLLLDYALNFQKPRLIVMDVIMATNFGRPVIGTEQGTNMTHLALDPVPLSVQKIRGMLSTQGITEAGEILFPVIMSHQRLQQGQLTYRDWIYPFRQEAHPMKGYNYTRNAIAYERPSEEAPAEVFPLPDALEAELRDFIVYCREKNLPLLLIKTPIVGNGEMYRQFNRIGEIAAEYGVPYLDFNHHYDNLDIDFSADFADKGHLNCRGAAKVSRFLADYLSEHYELPDRRGQAGYESWEQSALHYHNMDELDTVETLRGIAERAADHELLTIFALGGPQGSEAHCRSAEELAALHALGLEKFPRCDSGAYYAVLDGGKCVREEYRPNKELDDTFKAEDRHFYVHAAAEEADGERRMGNINLGSGGFEIKTPGLLVVSYDKDTQTIIDRVRFTADSDWQAFREF